MVRISLSEIICSIVQEAMPMCLNYISAVGGEVKHGVWVYRRCLYCNKGKADVQYMFYWHIYMLPVIILDIFQGEGMYIINIFSHLGNIHKLTKILQILVVVYMTWLHHRLIFYSIIKFNI